MSDSYIISFRPEAERELREAAFWYEERRKGLGSAFMLTVDAAISSIQPTPMLYPKIYGSKRRARLKTFPYGIFFEIEGNVIVILGVYHARRNPNKLKKRR